MNLAKLIRLDSAEGLFVNSNSLFGLKLWLCLEALDLEFDLGVDFSAGKKSSGTILLFLKVPINWFWSLVRSRLEGSQKESIKLKPFI